MRWGDRETGRWGDFQFLTHSPARRVPLSQLWSSNKNPAWTVTESDDWSGLFDGGLNLRVERWVVTGGVVRGFSHALRACANLPRKPRVVEFTMEDGSVQTGVLMPVGFNPNAPIPEPGAAPAKKRSRVQTVTLSPASERIIRRIMTGRLRLPV